MSGLETGAFIASSSLLTLIIRKAKCLIKPGSDSPCLCGFMDAPLVDNDDIEFKTVNINGLSLAYIGPKQVNLMKA